MPTYSRTDAGAATATSRNILHLTPHMRVEQIDEEEGILNISATAADAARLRGPARLGPHSLHSATLKTRNTVGNPSRPAPVPALAHGEKYGG